MPTVSNIDGSRWYRYRNHTRAIRSPSNSVSWFIEKTHSRHVKKSQRSRLHARGEGRRGQWTSVKAIYVNAETRILIYILCGSEFAIVIPGEDTLGNGSQPAPFPLLGCAREARDVQCLFLVCDSRSGGARDGDEKVTKPCVRGKHWIYRVFDIPESINAGRTSYESDESTRPLLAPVAVVT